MRGQMHLLSGSCLLYLVVEQIYGAAVGGVDRSGKGRGATHNYELWDPNYCNDTTLQEGAGLKKTALGQFLGFDCDPVFFHCRWGIAGWRTYRKKCHVGLVYDTSGTQNCNYDFNVEGCNTHNSCADCFDGQFSCCLSEECVEAGQRCDGTYDCVLEEDEQNCPTCSKDEFPCVMTDRCVPLSTRCNGVNDCGGAGPGTDEENCEACAAGFFYCANSDMCVEAEKRCDGEKDCSNGEDEVFCHSDEDKRYLCWNQVDTIPMDQLCDGIDHCPDGTDEVYCDGGDATGFNGDTFRNGKTRRTTASPAGADDEEEYDYDEEE